MSSCSLSEAVTESVLKYLTFLLSSWDKASKNLSAHHRSLAVSCFYPHSSDQKCGGGVHSSKPQKGNAQGQALRLTSSWSGASEPPWTVSSHSCWEKPQWREQSQQSFHNWNDNEFCWRTRLESRTVCPYLYLLNNAVCDCLHLTMFVCDLEVWNSGGWFGMKCAVHIHAPNREELIDFCDPTFLKSHLEV